MKVTNFIQSIGVKEHRKGEEMQELSHKSIHCHFVPLNLLIPVWATSSVLPDQIVFYSSTGECSKEVDQSECLIPLPDESDCLIPLPEKSDCLIPLPDKSECLIPLPDKRV